ncbi:MAG TPA: exodeoxyribonuclease VII large subunit [Limnochordales bacterium]
MSASSEPAAAGWAAPAPWASAAPGGQVLTVTELTQRIRSRLQADPRLSSVAVAGELSGFKRHSASGHCYFALKDQHSRLNCVMWREWARQVEFEPADGTQVVAVGYVDVYGPAGTYQLYVQRLYPVGLGLLYARLRALYERLAREGLFDEARKRPLPRWPRAVGVVTSLDGAAVRDIAAVIRRRSPSTPVVIAPARVQGDGAAQQVVRGLALLSGWPGVDVIVVARGGGARDELWTFNDESIVRAIASCPVPVISAVGHETDVTLADLAADRRAPTPSAAAELAVPDEAAERARVEGLVRRLQTAMRRRLERGRERWQRLAGHWTLTRPTRWLAAHRQRLDELTARLRSATEQSLHRGRLRWTRWATRLSAADPLALLERGYAVVLDPVQGRPVRRAAQLHPGESVRVELWDGRLDCSVRHVEPLRRSRLLAEGVGEDGAGRPGPAGLPHTSEGVREEGGGGDGR